MDGDGGVSRALVIEDEPDVSRLLALVLGQAGWTVVEAATGAAGLEAARAHEPDLVTLDLSLPDLDGLEVCRRLRQVTDAYIVMLTARAGEMDRLLGLQTGADDYMTKPFSPRELVARAGAMMRRPRRLGGETGVPRPVTAGRLTINRLRRDVRVDDVSVELTKTEFDLLAELARGGGRVWTRRELVEAVWGTGWAGDDHTVDVHVANLRRKLADSAGGLSLVETVRGVGYRLSD
jgi:two-component system OmpR family response regulator